jgi:hypothetical protein
MTLEATSSRLHTTSTDAIRLVVFGRLMPATFFAQLGYAQLLRVVGDVRTRRFIPFIW